MEIKTGQHTILRVNAEKYRAKSDHDQNLTYLYLEFIERDFMFSKVLGLISKYGLHSGIFVKMNFTRCLAYFMARMSKCSFCTRYKNFLELFGGRF